MVAGYGFLSTFIRFHDFADNTNLNQDLAIHPALNILEFSKKTRTNVVQNKAKQDFDTENSNIQQSTYFWLHIKSRNNQIFYFQICHTFFVMFSQDILFLSLISFCFCLKRPSLISLFHFTKRRVSISILIIICFSHFLAFS